jgi:hypothetical protein
MAVGGRFDGSPRGDEETATIGFCWLTSAKGDETMVGGITPADNTLLSLSSVNIVGRKLEPHCPQKVALVCIFAPQFGQFVVTGKGV